MNQAKNAYLVLEDGHVFNGYSFGVKGTAHGEICFNTGMTGYQEVFTDPSYFGQLLILNNVHVGNYGINKTDQESGGVKIRGLIARSLEEKFSRYTATESLKDYFIKNNIVAVDGIDTRALVTYIRSKGAMNAILSTDGTDVESLKQKVKELPKMEGQEFSSKVTTKEVYELGNPNAAYRIAVLDFGIKQNILSCLLGFDIFIKVFPATTEINELKSFNPDGYFISNGPGDPAAMGYAVETIKDILKENKPFFGICLGQQLLGLANGIKTFKMKHGHRGINHPVKNLMTGLCEITTQNHGFGIDAESVKQNPQIEITHINLNDGSIEGIRLKDKPVFSVQYHPESTPGPHDSRYLFEDFFKLIQAAKN